MGLSQARGAFVCMGTLPCLCVSVCLQHLSICLSGLAWSVSGGVLLHGVCLSMCISVRVMPS